MIVYVNLWTRKGLLGGADLFHLSRPYNTLKRAEEGQSVAPDDKWKFVETFQINLKNVVKD